MDFRRFNHGLPLRLTDKREPLEPVKDRVFMTTEELAIRWRKSKRTIENYRYSIKKDGLPFYKINGSVRYDLNDIIKYELDNYFGELTSA